MPEPAVPPGWSYNPSRFSKRLPILLIALPAWLHWADRRWRSTCGPDT